jgi:hypothetical protein
MIAVRVDSSAVRAELERLGSRVNRARPLLQAAVRAVRKTLQQHFKERDRTANQLGGRRTHFWLDVYKSTQIGEVTDRQATVVIGDRRFAQKVFGGTIQAGKGKSSKTGGPTQYLAIPIDPEAYGRRPYVLQSTLGIRLFMLPKKVAGQSRLLAATTQGHKIKLYYVLRRSVTQEADAEAFPAQSSLERAAVDAAESCLRASLPSSGPSV